MGVAGYFRHSGADAGLVLTVKTEHLGNEPRSPPGMNHVLLEADLNTSDGGVHAATFSPVSLATTTVLSSRNRC